MTNARSIAIRQPAKQSAINKPDASAPSNFTNRDARTKSPRSRSRGADLIGVAWPNTLISCMMSSGADG